MGEIWQAQPWQYVQNEYRTGNETETDRVSIGY